MGTHVFVLLGLEGILLHLFGVDTVGSFLGPQISHVVSDAVSSLDFAAHVFHIDLVLQNRLARRFGLHLFRLLNVVEQVRLVHLQLLTPLLLDLLQPLSHQV